MTFALMWLPKVLKDAGLKVAETDGWKERGRGPMGTVRGVICHHTATKAAGNMPSLELLKAGRSDLAGPLAQLGLGRDGTFYVVAAGRANHAGLGQWEGLTTGNSSFIGIEAENNGVGERWPDVQMDAYRRGVAAILKEIGADAIMCAGHKEYAPHRKSDPTFDMLAFRRGVAEFLLGKTPLPPIAAVDAARRPTLRRGMHGDQVERAQTLLKLPADGIFGGKTEAEVRTVQRREGLVPDGIIGPATWRVLEPTDSATTAAVVAGAAGSAAVAAGVAAPVQAGPPGGPAKTPEPDSTGRRPRSDGRRAFGPDGKPFAHCSRGGFCTSGSTTIASWLASLGPAAPAASPSSIRVLNAMSVNEGNFEAVNSYDGCFMSFGILQWTAGKGSDPGELAFLLQTLKQDDPAAFDDCFGAFGLDVAAQGFTGELTLDGRPLLTPEEKRVLRDVVWAYRFWRAGHVPTVRAAQFKVAAGRIARFRSAKVAGKPLSDWITSERGMAHLLDEHVNRPGNVPKTLAAAVARLYGANVTDPAGFDDDAEAELIDTYLDLRADTSMTDSDKRAARIDAAVGPGKLSDIRKSFA